MKRRVFHELASLPSNHVLNACRGWLSVIRPYARTNIVTNPSVETATTGYTAVGGSIARSTTEQYHGAYSLAVTPSAGNNSDGVFYGSVSLTASTTYAYSCKFKGTAGRQYTISIATTGGVNLTAYTFTATGKWQWVWGFWTETSSTSRRFYIRKNAHSDASVFYVDGLQIEACGSEGVFVTTYIDGDQQSVLAQPAFPPPYGWNGTRHASTSYRSAQTRDGGRVLNFDRFLLLITAISGLGIAPPTHLVGRQSQGDGAAYETSFVNARAIEVATRWNTRSTTQADQARKDLGAAIAIDATQQRQPLTLLYQKYDGLRPLGDVGKIIASYSGGLEGQWDNLIGESPTITFTQWLPFIAGPDSGANLTQSTNVTITDVATFMVRSESGVWSQGGANAGSFGVMDIAIHPDGTIYLVGDFTSIGGTSANRVARYDPSTGAFSALGTGLAGGATPIGRRVRIGPNGDVYVAGSFTTAGGTTVNNVARWDGATWNAMGSGGTKGVDNGVNAMTLDIDGNVYVAGSFANAGGAGAVRIAKWTLATNAWSALSTGLNADANALATGLDGKIYVGGTFTTAGGVAAEDLAYWNGSTFVSMGSGVGGGIPGDLVVAPDGSIYLGGLFTAVNGISANNVARWNGAQWRPLGSGTGAIVGRLAFAPDGLLYATGAGWGTLNNITVSFSFGIWNGSSWILPDLTMPGASVGAIGLAISQKGEIYLGTNNGSAGTATAAATATLTNDGTSLAYPTFYITGPSTGSARLYQIRNITSGQTVSFNLSINALEVITIRVLPGQIVVTSSFRGNISSAVVRGSAQDLPLLKGANAFALYAPGSTITITAVWAKRYADAADLSYAP